MATEFEALIVQWQLAGCQFEDDQLYEFKDDKGRGCQVRHMTVTDRLDLTCAHILYQKMEGRRAMVQANLLHITLSQGPELFIGRATLAQLREWLR